MKDTKTKERKKYGKFRMMADFIRRDYADIYKHLRNTVIQRSARKCSIPEEIQP